eukprot:263916_1
MAHCNTFERMKSQTKVTTFDEQNEAFVKGQEWLRKADKQNELFMECFVRAVQFIQVENNNNISSEDDECWDDDEGSVGEILKAKYIRDCIKLCNILNESVSDYEDYGASTFSSRQFVNCGPWSYCVYVKHQLAVELYRISTCASDYLDGFESVELDYLVKYEEQITSYLEEVFSCMFGNVFQHNLFLVFAQRVRNSWDGCITMLRLLKLPVTCNNLDVIRDIITTACAEICDDDNTIEFDDLVIWETIWRLRWICWITRLTRKKNTSISTN